jgi:hypothetical protein
MYNMLIFLLYAELLRIVSIKHWNFTSTGLKNGFGGVGSSASKIFIEDHHHYELSSYPALP